MQPFSELPTYGEWALIVLALSAVVYVLMEVHDRIVFWWGNWRMRKQMGGEE